MYSYTKKEDKTKVKRRINTDKISNPVQPQFHSLRYVPKNHDYEASVHRMHSENAPIQRVFTGELVSLIKTQKPGQIAQMNQFASKLAALFTARKKAEMEKKSVYV